MSVEDVAQWWNLGMTWEEIAHRLKMCRNTLYSVPREFRPKMLLLGLKERRKIVGRVFRLWKEGMSVKDIARREKLSARGIYTLISGPQRKAKFMATRKSKKIAHQKVIQLWKAGVPAKEVADQVCTTASTIYSLIGQLKRDGKLEREVRTKRRISIDPDHLIQMWREGVSAKEMASQWGTSEQVVFQKIMKLRKKNLELALRCNFKVEPEKFLPMWNAGVPVAEIAREFGVSQDSITKLAADSAGKGNQRFYGPERRFQSPGRLLARKKRNGGQKGKLSTLIRIFTRNWLTEGSS